MARTVRDAGSPAPRRTSVPPTDTTQDNPKARLAALIAATQEKVRARDVRLGTVDEELPELPRVQVASVAPNGPGPEERRAAAAVSEVQAFSDEQVGKAGKLTGRSREVYEFFHLFSSALAHTKKQSLKAHQITVFCPGELVRDLLGMPQSTFYNVLKRLKEVGLIDYRGHRTTLPKFYSSRCDGTVFAIKLHPERTGEARLCYDDLKATYRNLEADIDEGRTWYRIGRSITWGGNLGRAVSRLLSWQLLGHTLPSKGAVPKTPFLTLQSACLPELIADVLLGPRVERPRRIEMAATAVTVALGDGHSYNFWRLLLRRMVRRADEGRDYSSVLVSLVQRARVDRTEGFARKAGALAVARLKQTGVYKELVAA